MLGDFTSTKNKFKDYCITSGISPSKDRLAIDLGAGNGIQSIALAELGFKVKAVDFNNRLLSELEAKIDNYPIEIINDNIVNLGTFAKGQPVCLIVCCGDTISHLDTFGQLDKLLLGCYNILVPGGRLVLTFRDYSIELTDNQRFIPVRSDENRILTCIIDYFDDRILVTDLLHEKENNKWIQKISSYYKLRVTTDKIIEKSQEIGFSVSDEDNINGMIHLILQKR